MPLRSTLVFFIILIPAFMRAQSSYNRTVAEERKMQREIYKGRLDKVDFQANVVLSEGTQMEYDYHAAKRRLTGQNGFEKDTVKGIRGIIATGEKGYLPAMMYLGYLYIEGILLPKDTALGLKFVRSAIKKQKENVIGDSTDLKCLLHFGSDLITTWEYQYRDTSEALFYLRMAEEQSVSAGWILGVLYLEGIGVPRDSVKADEYFLKASFNSRRVIDYQLGYDFEKGLIVKADTARALDYYRHAATANHRWGNFKMGEFYHNGFVVQKDDDIAVRWYQKAADSGVIDAYYQIASIYFKGDGLPRDYSRAFENYFYAADKGNTQAMYFLGSLYEKGKGIIKNDTTAVSWYKRASDQGNAYGRGALGVMYYEGRGLQKDTAQGLKLIREAAASGVDYYTTYLELIGIPAIITSKAQKE